MKKTLFPSLTALFVALLLPTLAWAGPEMITNGSFMNDMTGWTLVRLENASARAAVESIGNGKMAVHVTVPEPAAKRYFVHLLYRGIALRSNETYHLSFRARAKPGGEIVLTAASYRAAYAELWRQEHVALTEAWQDYHFDFSPKSADESAELLLNGLGDKAAEFWFTDISLTEAN